MSVALAASGAPSATHATAATDAAILILDRAIGAAFVIPHMSGLPVSVAFRACFAEPLGEGPRTYRGSLEPGGRLPGSRARVNPETGFRFQAECGAGG